MRRLGLSEQVILVPKSRIRSPRDNAEAKMSCPLPVRFTRSKPHESSRIVVILTIAIPAAPFASGAIQAPGLDESASLAGSASIGSRRDFR